MKSKVQRISDELVTELQNMAMRNNIKIIDASKEVARLIRKNRNKVMVREIKF